MVEDGLWRPGQVLDGPAALLERFGTPPGVDPRERRTCRACGLSVKRSGRGPLQVPPGDADCSLRLVKSVLEA